MKEVAFASHEINQRNIYGSSLAMMNQMTKHRGKREDKHDRKIGRMSMRLQWLNEFSDIGNEI